MTAWSPFERRIVLLDSGERFADPHSEFAGDLTQDVQDVFFSWGLRLLFVEDVSRAAVLGAQPQYILAAEAGDRALQDGGASGSLADFLGDLRRQLRIRRLAHQRKRMPNTLIGEQAQERRLFQLIDSPWRRVSSKTGSPVVLRKSARMIGSLSVSAGAR